ncbi:MAG: hypothetical protein KDA79_01140 [Planctomycetaceae bacterium]|nr:hypothetical protein [Planctomycetaceae bacterium]
MKDTLPARPPLHLFEGFGVELEYMIASADRLDVAPIADQLLAAAALDEAATGEPAAAGTAVSDVEFGPVAWSNELVLHVLEFKTNGPAASLQGLSGLFHENIQRASRLLSELGGQLLPTAMHPWMDPAREMQLWPHDYGPVYEAFDRIFDCRGHGWANLQSVHINLPFAGSETDSSEFGRLHAAIRLLLPLLPGLAASSPIHDGQPAGFLDSRLDVYRRNARAVPSVSGRVIPERAFSRSRYDELIFQPMYTDIAPHDPAGLLQEEFLNSRGAIARFERGAIEIRVLDIQECPAADVAICAAIVAVLRRLVAEEWTPLSEQQSVEIEPLERVLLASIRDADQAIVEDAGVLAQFGLAARRWTVGEIWQALLERECRQDSDFAATWLPSLQPILEHGPLARRILRRTGPTPDRARLRAVWRELGECLVSNEPFVV